MKTVKPQKGDLRVWWIPQVPGKQFRVSVATPQEAKKLLGILADYDLFQFANKIKPDYCNAGGLEVLNGIWEDWHDDKTGCDIDSFEAQP